MTDIVLIGRRNSQYRARELSVCIWLHWVVTTKDQRCAIGIISFLHIMLNNGRRSFWSYSLNIWISDLGPKFRPYWVFTRPERPHFWRRASDHIGISIKQWLKASCSDWSCSPGLVPGPPDLYAVLWNGSWCRIGFCSGLASAIFCISFRITPFSLIILQM